MNNTYLANVTYNDKIDEYIFNIIFGDIKLRAIIPRQQLRDEGYDALKFAARRLHELSLLYSQLSVCEGAFLHILVDCICGKL